MLNNKIEFTEDENDLLRAVDEYYSINGANALSDLLDMLPDNPKEIYDRIDNELPKDPKEQLIRLQEMINTDFEFVSQVMALKELEQIYQGFEEVETIDQEYENIYDELINAINEMK